MSRTRKPEPTPEEIRAAKRRRIEEKLAAYRAIPWREILLGPDYEEDTGYAPGPHHATGVELPPGASLRVGDPWRP